MRSTTAARRGRITLDEHCCHVCTCSEHVEYGECEGHPAGPFDPMGVTVYCDGRCNQYAAYTPTVHADKSIEPTEGGSWFYVCSRCGAGAWSGC